MNLRFAQLCLIVTTFCCCGAAGQDQDDVDLSDACNRQCEGKTHTFCGYKNDPKRNPACKNAFDPINFGDHQALREILILGHNGLRDRVALYMSVANMIELEWDENLSKMAREYMKECKFFTSDVCTLYTHDMSDVEAFEKFYTIYEPYEFISQNTYFIESNFMPYEMIEKALVTWYLEKNVMSPPSHYSIGWSNVAKLIADNNFTHLTYPNSYRFGCGLSQSGSGFHLVCNYYPYFRSVNASVFYIHDDPATKCPAGFPLRDKLFNYLCTQYKDSSHVILPSVVVSGVLFFFMQIFV